MAVIRATPLSVLVVLIDTRETPLIVLVVVIEILDTPVSVRVVVAWIRATPVIVCVVVDTPAVTIGLPICAFIGNVKPFRAIVL